MSKVIRYLPELQDDEQLHVASLFHDMSDEQAEQFSRVYRQRRKDANITLITGLAMFVGIAGIHRQLAARHGDAHRAEHQMIECLAETLWEAQSGNHPPDEQKYLERLRRLTGGTL